MNPIKTILSRIIIFFAIGGLLAYLCSYAYFKAGSMGKRPNILLITICSLRQDHLSCFGYPRPTSPHIDELAKSSIIFTNCYTPIPWTIPSIEALMTGTYPFSSLNLPKKTSLIKLLHSCGYATSGVVGTFVEKSDFNPGFDTFFGPRNLKTGKDINTVGADVISRKAIEILASRANKKTPMFLWVFFKDAHWPYLPPSPYRKRFLNDSLYSNNTQQLKISGDFHDSIGGIGEARLEGADGKFITDKAYYISQYDAEILFADKYIGEIVDYIKNTGKFEDWIIILLSDHGESLGEDDYLFDHGYELSEGLVKVPLIIKLPGQERGEVKSDFVSVCDIYYTIADLLKVKRMINQPHTYGRSILCREGHSAVCGNTNRILMLNNSPTHEKRGEKILGCIQDNYKLIWNRSKNERMLYNLAGQEVLIREYNEEQRRLMVEMTEFTRRFFNKSSEEDQDKRCDNIEELKALGYVQ